MATDLITLAEGAVLSQFLGPFGKSLGEAALKRAQQLGERAVGYLTAVGRAPQPVAPKVLLPLVQAAALEEDEGLVAKWAALLANAADPAQGVLVQPGFVEVLRQLTSLDARILEAVAAATAQGVEQDVRSFYYCLATQIQREVGEGNEAPTFAFRVALDNLLRLGLLLGRGMTRPQVEVNQGLTAQFIAFHADTLAQGPGKDRLAMTDLSLALLEACTPPTP